MKKQTMKTTAALSIMLIATLGSCQKGDTGAQGVAGTNGTNGTNGNANVHSSSIQVVNADWAYNLSGWDYYTALTYPEITQDVVDNGTVQVFLGGNNGTWEALPVTVYYQTSSLNITYQYEYSVGAVNLFLDLSTNATFTAINTLYYKVVAIGGAQKKSHPNTNWKDYNQVQAVLNETNTIENSTIATH